MNVLSMVKTAACVVVASPIIVASSVVRSVRHSKRSVCEAKASMDDVISDVLEGVLCDPMEAVMDYDAYKVVCGEVMGDKAASVRSGAYSDACHYVAALKDAVIRNKAKYSSRANSRNKRRLDKSTVALGKAIVNLAKLECEMAVVGEVYDHGLIGHVSCV